MKDQTTTTQEPAFNAAPLLDIVGGTGAADTATLLDEAIHYLTQSFIESGEYNGLYYASMLDRLRELRNAILKGGNILDIDRLCRPK